MGRTFGGPDGPESRSFLPEPDLGNDHDPGPEAARTRASVLSDVGARYVRRNGSGLVTVGTAGWTDATLTAAGVFYPPGAESAEARLRYYATRFASVEIDSSYYGIPVRRQAEGWVERTPDDFTFTVKANALMTGHPSEPGRLPKAIRSRLPSALAEKPRIYGHELPAELYDAVWDTFLSAIAPLHAAGKLDAVVLQFPAWFHPNTANTSLLIDVRRRLGDYPGAVEFRHRSWVEGRTGERTLALLREQDLAFVMVDAPPGLESGMPPVSAVTSPKLAVVRLHGRRAAFWERPQASVAERFRYLYDRAELREWVAPVLDAAERAERVQVTFNNCYANYGTTNALEFLNLLLLGLA